MKAKHFASIFAGVALSLCVAVPAFARPAVLNGREPGSRINVRSAPSTQAYAPHYGLVGDRVEVLRSVEGRDGYIWYYVRFPSQAEGWIRADFILLTSEAYH